VRLINSSISKANVAVLEGGGDKRGRVLSGWSYSLSNKSPPWGFVSILVRLCCFNPNRPWQQLRDIIPVLHNFIKLQNCWYNRCVLSFDRDSGCDLSNDVLTHRTVLQGYRIENVAITANYKLSGTLLGSLIEKKKKKKKLLTYMRTKVIIK
jgi:hypothetical protein